MGDPINVNKAEVKFVPTLSTNIETIKIKLNNVEITLNIGDCIQFKRIVIPGEDPLTKAKIVSFKHLVDPTDTVVVVGIEYIPWRPKEKKWGRRDLGRILGLDEPYLGEQYKPYGDWRTIEKLDSCPIESASPASDPRGYGQSGYSQPVSPYQSPAYQAPAYQAPVYQSPAYQASVHPGYAYQAPVYPGYAYQAPAYAASPPQAFAVPLPPTTPTATVPAQQERRSWWGFLTGKPKPSQQQRGGRRTRHRKSHRRRQTRRR